LKHKHSFAVVVLWVSVLSNSPATALAAIQYKAVDVATLPGMPPAQPNSGTAAYDVNNSGQLTGFSYSRTPNGTVAFRYDGTYQQFGAFGYNQQNTSALRGTAINGSGQVTGVTNFGNETHAFVYDGTVHDLGTLGGKSSHGADINTLGQVVGHASLLGDSVTHAFFYDGAMHDLGTLGGGNGSVATAINDYGQIVGSAQFPGNIQHAFLYDGTMHDLGTLGGTNSWAVGINNQGQIVGNAQVAGGAYHAFLYDGTMHDLGSLGGGVAVDAINNHGQVVGGSGVPAGGGSHAYLYDHGVMVDLNSLVNLPLGVTLIEGLAINDAGQILALTSVPNDTQYHTFLLTPVPEPSSLVLGVMASVAMVAVALRRAR